MVALQILVLPVGVRILLGERKTPNTHRVRFFFRIGSLRLSVRTKDSQSLKTSSTLVGTENRFLICYNTRNYKYRPKSCKQICKQFGRLFLFVHPVPNFTNGAADELPPAVYFVQKVAQIRF